MKNLVVVSPVFTPSSAIGARRFGEILLYLSEFGYQPWVICMAGEGKASRSIPENQIIRIGKFTRGELGAARWSSDFALGRWMENLGLRSIFFDPSLLSFALRVFKRRAEIERKIGKVDCMLGTFGPSSALWITERLSANWGCPWIADFRDLGALRENNRILPVRKIDCLLESRLLRSASAITTVSKTLGEILQKFYQKPTTVIYNGFDLENSRFSSTDGSTNPWPDKPYFHYAGQLYEHQMQGVQIFLKALKKVPPLLAVFRILGPKHLELAVLKMVEKEGIADRVFLLPPQERTIVLREAQTSFSNIVFEDISKKRLSSRGTITGKFLGLLPLSPPILAISREDSEIGEILKETGRGQLCDQENQIIQFIEVVQSTPEIFKSDLHLMEPYSKREQAKKLATFLDENTERLF